MACFLSGQTAELLGVGMQAIGIGIPIGNTSAKIVESLRNYGFPVPPKTWFKPKNNEKFVTLRQPTAVYDELENHINGFIQSAKSSIELKNIFNGFESENHARNERANTHHTIQKTKPTILLEPNDIIDLTQDVPNTILRSPRNHNEEDINLNERPRKKQKNVKIPAIINLDDTINLDDSLNNTNMTKKIPITNKSENKKQNLSCPICLDSLSDENIKAMSTPCGHLYCLECLKVITQTKSKCSICQRPIKFVKCIRLHI